MTNLFFTMMARSTLPPPCSKLGWRLENGKDYVFRILLLVLLACLPVQVLAETFEKALEHFINRQYAKAAEGFQTLSDEGEPLSKSYLGRMYLLGLHFSADSDKGDELMFAATEEDRTGESDYWYAQSWMGGWGDQEPSPDLALLFYEEAAKKGFPRAFFSLGRAYLEGEHVEKDIALARQYMEKGERLGSNGARLDLANLLSSDEELPPEPETAIRLYKKYMEVERAAGRTDLLWVSEERIKMMEALIEKNAVRFVTEPQFPYTGELPACDPGKEFWTDCYGIRAVEWDDGGSRYEGEWKDNQHHGKGAIISAQGWIYRGDMEMGLRKGQAEFIWEDGSRYVGGWKGIGMHGFGKMYNPKGELVYEGEYKDAKRWSAEDQHAALEKEAQAICETAFRRKYEFSETDKYGNRTEQRFEHMHYGYMIDGDQSAYRGYGGHPTLVYALVMFKNGWIIRGKPEGYCVFRRGTYLKTNELIDVEIKVKG